MMYGRIVSNQIQLAPSTVVYQGKSYANPPWDVLEELGWKIVILTLPPAETGYEATWSETSSSIVQTWSAVVQQISEPPPEEPGEEPPTEEQ